MDAERRRQQARQLSDFADTLIAQRLSEQRPAHLPPLQVCIQVNTDGGPTKAGVAPAALDELADAVRGNVYAPDCPSRALLDHVTTRWGVLVLSLLLDRARSRLSFIASQAGGMDKAAVCAVGPTGLEAGPIQRGVQALEHGFAPPQAWAGVVKDCMTSAMRWACACGMGR